VKENDEPNDKPVETETTKQKARMQKSKVTAPATRLNNCINVCKKGESLRICSRATTSFRWLLRCTNNHRDFKKLEEIRI
jgi:hypothetical protein